MYNLIVLLPLYHLLLSGPGLLWCHQDVFRNQLGIHACTSRSTGKLESLGQPLTDRVWKPMDKCSCLYSFGGQFWGAISSESPAGIESQLPTLEISPQGTLLLAFFLPRFTFSNLPFLFTGFPSHKKLLAWGFKI